MRLSLSLLIALATPLGAAVDYSAQIKPLLQTHCVKCHGATTQKGGLRLDTAVAAIKGGERGAAILAGKGSDSLLYQVTAGLHAEIPQMPYKRGPLDSAQIQVLKQWIDEGARAPLNELPSDDRHWAYIPPEKPPFPSSQKGQNPIDYFISEKLKQAGLKSSSPASPETLLRRLHLDITGLPPTPEQVLSFMRKPAAYEQRITELLESPHYGERWGRWWLDQARYADSNGYSIDAPRSIWPYRDWVIKALNADMPFDQFSVEQLAGDMLPQPSQDQLIATGFHRNTQINQEGGIDKEQFRIESIFDRVATTGTVWLGLSIGCAQCHDHKFDAISHEEYFRLFAFLNNQDEPTLTLKTDSKTQEDQKAELVSLEKRLAAFLAENQRSLEEWEAKLDPVKKAKLTKNQLAALKRPANKRSFAQQSLLFAAGPGVSNKVFRADYDRYQWLSNELAKATTTLVMRELAQPRQTTLFIKGDFTRPGSIQTPAVPAALHDLNSANPNRLDLARWLVSRENPLTARVTVNRVWQQYFGRGLVETENDFGTMGSLPTHPELLDWLAVELMEKGWSLKHLHRLIVSSETYKQSSSLSHEARNQEIDPNNLLLWRQNRLRLDAEIVRDVCLSASGLLQSKIGGPPVYPPIPEGVMSLGQVKRAWPLSSGSDRYRRGLYTFVFRATPPPGLSVFDAPDGFSSCTRRLRSNTPLQALTLLNDSAFVEFAEALAKIIKQEGLETAFLRCTARMPSDAERALLLPLQPEEIARVLLNLDETITRE